MLVDISVELGEIHEMVRGIDGTYSDKQDIIHIADKLQGLCTKCYDTINNK